MDIIESHPWHPGASRLHLAVNRDPHAVRRILNGAYPPHPTGTKTLALVWFWAALYRNWASIRGLEVAWTDLPLPHQIVPHPALYRTPTPQTPTLLRKESASVP